MVAVYRKWNSRPVDKEYVPIKGLLLNETRDSYLVVINHAGIERECWLPKRLLTKVTVVDSIISFYAPAWLRANKLKSGNYTSNSELIERRLSNRFRTAP